MAKHKFASISLTVRDSAISSKFSTRALYSWQFSKNFPLPKNGGHFEFLPKMAKHKFASISLTVRDRAISLKFSTHRVSKECTLCNFQKIFPSPKNGGHFEFSNFCQKWQNTNLLLSPFFLNSNNQNNAKNKNVNEYRCLKEGVVLNRVLLKVVQVYLFFYYWKV